jgi:hypothetical protein
MTITLVIIGDGQKYLHYDSFFRMINDGQKPRLRKAILE